MRDEHAVCEGYAWCTGTGLQSIWRVDADRDYHVHPHRRAENGLVAIRTLSGEGVVNLGDAGVFHLGSDTLMIAEIRLLEYYGTAEESWQFQWYEFSRESGVGLPLNVSMPMERSAWEDETAEYVFKLLSSPSQSSNVAASALFGALLHDWSVRGFRETRSTDRHRRLVDRAIVLMQADLAATLGIDDLAKECGVSARGLRQAFVTVLGMSPKKYQTHIRLTRAAHALQMGLGTVTELSEQLGYSSLFHLSRAFKSKFGCSPSQYVNQRTVPS